MIIGFGNKFDYQLSGRFGESYTIFDEVTTNAEVSSATLDEI